MPTAAQVAQDVTDLINALPAQTSFTKKFAAKRVYLPAFDPQYVKDLTVRVCPNQIERAIASRSNVEKDISVWIGVAQLLPAPPSSPTADIDAALNLAIDPIVAVSEQIEDVFIPGLKLPTGVTWIKTDHPLQFDRDAFRKHRVLLTWIGATFRLIT